MKAFLKNYRQSPRKVRLVADLVKGKGLPQALAELDFLSKRAGDPIKKLIKSAAANAKTNFGTNEESLFIKSITVDKGHVMKRFQPASRGRAHPIRKKMSNVAVTLESREPKQKLPKVAKKTTKK
ncbi:MAG TPA: 50S ribosomal protein L22 [Candidatus Paceibacterota bacterium]|nr:50S ribosomal protein L22 [Candidatus Paceibacterota bacterium]